MTNQEFKTKARAWINHKLILANNSEWYRPQARKDAIFHVKNLFSAFLQFPVQYNEAQLALQIKKHEDLLMNVLPVPNNPAYNTAFSTLADLLKKSTEILIQHNLQSLVK